MQQLMCLNYWEIKQNRTGHMCFDNKGMRNDMSTIFSQQILSGRLLLVIIVRKKININVSFKFEPITTNYL